MKAHPAATDVTATPDLTYAPFQASGVAAALYGLVAAAFCAFNFFSSGEWMPWPPPSGLHVFGYGLVLTSPIMALQFGWSYALSAHEFVVYRFRKERYRLALRDYQGTQVVPGVLRLRFRTRMVWLVSGVDAARQAFLAELQRRAAVVGPASGPTVWQLDRERIRVPLSQLGFPARCVACGAASEGTTALTVQRGFDAILIARFQYVNVQVPVCEVHASQRRTARWLSWLALVPLTFLAAAVLMLVLDGGVFRGALIIGGVISIVVHRPLQSMASGQWLDWLVLGMKASELSPDLTEVTLRIRNMKTLHDVLVSAKTTSGESQASVGEQWAAAYVP